jgi:glycosyltransferase involved in cell wall biosynthesis
LTAANSTPIRSVHITNYYHKNSGGISTSYNNLMAAAARHKRFVRLIVPGESEAVEDVNEYARIYYVPANYSPVFDKRYRLMMPWQYMSNDSVIRKILLQERPDLIEITDKYTLSMFGAMVRLGKFKQIGRPLLVHFSCERMDDNVDSFLSRGSFGKWLARTIIGKYTLPSFDYHLANSSYTAEEFTSAVKIGSKPDGSVARYWRWLRSPRIPLAERIRVCPRGVDAAHFRPERKSETIRREMTERAGVPEGAVLLLYAGRISPEKNIELMAETMRILAKDKSRDYRLLVAGDGPLADHLRDEGIKIGGNKIVLLGHLDKETLADYYANADIFVHPNPREPFGIAPLEAMASGVPTVAPRGGGILSYADDDNAWLVEPDAESFADAIREAATNEDLRRRRTENAVRTARENTREAATDRLFATYDEIYEDFLKRKELIAIGPGADPVDIAKLVT